MKIMLQDVESVSNADYIEWKELMGKTILITGGTGLIGTTLVKSLIQANKDRVLDIKIICIVRNVEKAREKLGNTVTLLTDSIEEEIKLEEDVDYIIHAANPTSSSFFIYQPVETIQIAVKGTINLLELAKEKNVKGFVYLSSMEVYGHPEKGHMVKESEIAGFDTMITRNCYPLSKQICEAICKAYQAEYRVPTKILRLTQTFGPGVEFNDGRVFAEFMRCAVNKTDIVLRTTGGTQRCYLYTTDAVTAILTVLTKGKVGEAYTAANQDTYCSIFEMAKMVAHEIAKDRIQVKSEMDDIDRGYASELFMKLDTSKIELLGWKASRGLKEMYQRMIESGKE